MGRVLSGIQPTGNLHLGNYLGAIKNWLTMQQLHECLYCIVDLHAITVFQNPAELLKSTRETAAAFIACGIDPKKSAIFNQSAVPEHSELAWILNCHTPLGWLNRMTQFKEKAGKHRENAVLGLYAYPVLMAADILIYKATHVPVGEDQKQHLELARDIAGAFNRAYGREFFPQPEPLILGEATRVMSLRDGTKKMSKSDPSDQSRIALTDDADAIANKFKKAKTDMEPGITYDEEKRPEVANLLRIFAALSGRPRAEIEKEFANSGFGQFKPALAELAITKLAPITAEMRRLMADPGYIDSVLRDGAERARAIATSHMNEVKDMVGMLRV
ncbi:MAG: tryptophan--tRNA ligase [Alphaproteobacteria bacterium]|nr:tryptophan--tRNA ligase [Alphaproteobacteria bacterium]